MCKIISFNYLLALYMMHFCIFQKTLHFIKLFMILLALFIVELLLFLIIIKKQTRAKSKKYRTLQLNLLKIFILLLLSVQKDVQMHRQYQTRRKRKVSWQWQILSWRRTRVLITEIHTDFGRSCITRQEKKRLSFQTHNCVDQRSTLMETTVRQLIQNFRICAAIKARI